MSEAGLSISKMLGSMDHVGIKLGSEIVIGVLSDVVPFGLGFLGTHLKSMSKSSLRNGKGIMAVGDVFVNTKVWDKVVNVITSWLLFMLVLATTSRRADWIRCNIRIKLNIIDHPSVAKTGLSITKMLGGVDHVGIKLWSKVIVGILGNIVPFGFRLFNSHLKSMSESSFRNCKRVVAIGDVLIDTEVGDKVVDVIASWLLLVLVLTTSGG
jgi:hypothetical protein